MLNKIVATLKQKEISMAKLAELTGIDKRTIYHILQNDEHFNKCSYKKITKILHALNIDNEPVIIAGDKIYHLNIETFNAVNQILSRLSIL